MSNKKGKTFRPKPKRAKGFEDRSGSLLRAEQMLVNAASSVFERHGFAPLATPSFEYAEVLGKFLPDEERPNAGVYSLLDDDEQWLSLRYDHTAPLARYVAANFDALPKPYRRYSSGPVWRNEKPGPGRFREFIQIDADTVGAAGAHVDTEMMILCARVLRAIGLTDEEFCIRVNDRRLADAVLAQIGISSDVDGEQQRGIILRAMDKLDRLGEQGVALLLGNGRKDESGDFTEGAKLTPGAIETVLAFTRAGGSRREDTLENLEKLLGSSEQARPALNDLRAMHGLLSAQGFADDLISFDPSIVRGLGYYTGPVFEAEILLETRNEKGQPVRFGSVGGGGRYDGLVARFKGVQVPATGFSFGVSRFAAAMASLGRLGKQTLSPVVILALEPEQMPAYMAMGDELREQGIRAEVYMGSSGMRAQMKYADKRGAPAVVIVGEDERLANEVTVKNLDLGSEMSKQITDNAVWREGRPAQVTGSRDLLVKLVLDALA